VEGTGASNMEIEVQDYPPIFQLPNELLLEIFEYLGFRDKLNLTFTCYGMRILISLHLNLCINFQRDLASFMCYMDSLKNSTVLPVVEGVNFDMKVNKNTKFILPPPLSPGLLVPFTSLTSCSFRLGLGVSDGSVIEGVLKSLPPGLKSLKLEAGVGERTYEEIRGTPIANATLKNWNPIKNLTSLTSLELEGIRPLGVEVLRLIAKLPLTSLKLECNIGGRGTMVRQLRIGPICTISSLTSLTIRNYRLYGGEGRDVVRDNVLQTLGDLTSLRHLRLEKCTGIGRDDTWNISSHSSLETLYLSTYEMTNLNRWWTQIGMMKNLTSLSVVQEDAAAIVGVNNGILQLKGLSKLKELHLPYITFSKRIMRELICEEGLTSLETLRCGCEGSPCSDIPEMRRCLEFRETTTNLAERYDIVTLGQVLPLYVHTEMEM